MSDIKFSVLGYSESSARIAVKARDFNIIIDEPASFGGEDKGPNPVEYLLSSIVGCLNVTGHLVAEEMGFTIKNLQIKASGSLNPARLFGKETSDRTGFKGIDIELLVDADTDATTLQQWLQKIELRCPVSDNLAHDTPTALSLKLAE
ncbi:MAG: hypothetical protein OFPII_23560 [Osedax symbiont Rs1]|nr:MAG: hypothetical protein OFPII_23560 [Osedax symbiont Rs1]